MGDTIQVTIDKSHLTTIGEKLYGESLELLRELISNSYDADASKVYVEVETSAIVETNTIKVKDNGSGMDEGGLREYFNIGSQNKRMANISLRYRRQKIGQFGIGKFAVLTACERFKIFTQKNGYAAEVVFDKNDWQKADQWTVPIQKLPYSPAQGNGTIVTLEKLKKNFLLPEVERFVREKIPLNAPHFEIYLNSKKIDPIFIAGTRFPIDIQTEYGRIQGEIIAPNFHQKLTDTKVGIDVTVNGVVIKKENFESDKYPGLMMYKLMGRVAADFLPITSDRSRFVTDSPHYEAFLIGMKIELRKITALLGEQSRIKQKQKADETLKETMSRLGKAIRKHPSFSPQIMSPTGEIDPFEEHPNSLAPEDQFNEIDSLEAFRLEISKFENTSRFQKLDEPKKDYNEERESRPEKIRIKNLKGKVSVARRIKIGDMGIVCNIESFGKNEKAVFTESGVIYINQDHRLYQNQAKLGKENLSFYLAFLLSQQIALLSAETEPSQAFDIQNKLLADTF